MGAVKLRLIGDFWLRLMVYVETVCSDLSHRAFPHPSNRLDQVVLMPHLDRGVVDEGIHKLRFVGVADREHLVVD